MSQVASSDGPTALPTQQNTNEASLRPAAGTTLAKMCRDLSEQERQNVTNGEPENAVLERYKRVSRLIEPGIFCAPQARRFLRHTDRRTRTSRFRHARQRQPASHPHSLTHSTLAHIIDRGLRCWGHISSLAVSRVARARSASKEFLTEAVDGKRGVGANEERYERRP